MIPQFAKLLKHDERLSLAADKMTCLTSTLVVTAASMLAMWLLSLALKDASIVDVSWGPGFVLIGATCFLVAGGHQPHQWLILSLTSIWGVRLAVHIFLRNRGKGEDFRYQAMRRRHGSRFAVVSLYTVFGVQGVLMWIVSLPIQAALCDTKVKGHIAFELLGLTLWTIGFLLEAVGDLQLSRFRRDPANRGLVMDRGLWRYTRHPNYFGDALLWWGFFIMAAPAEEGLGAATVISPVIMTVLLRKVSGVALLEKSLTKTKPQYQDYIRRTSAFFPWLPKK